METAASQDGTSSSRIKQFVLQTFPLARKRDFNDATDLLEGGIIDSLGVLDVVAFLQQEFAVSIDESDLTPENFKTVECMAKFVERMLELQAGSI